MKKISAMLVATAAMAVIPMTSFAGITGIGGGVKVGTLGTGLEVNYAVSSMFSVTAGINTFSRGMSQSASGIDYDVDLNLQTIALLANYHPFGGSFRLTAGAMINNNELSMKADPSATYDIGDLTYTSAEVGTLKAAVDFNRIAPYAGLGWGHSSGSGIGFTLDIGVLMQGSPNVDFSAKGGTLSSDPAFQAELAKEESNAEDDIKGFDIYPVIAAGINLRF